MISFDSLHIEVMDILRFIVDHILMPNKERALWEDLNNEITDLGDSRISLAAQA